MNSAGVAHPPGRQKGIVSTVGADVEYRPPALDELFQVTGLIRFKTSVVDFPLLIVVKVALKKASCSLDHSLGVPGRAGERIELHKDAPLAGMITNIVTVNPEEYIHSPGKHWFL